MKGRALIRKRSILLRSSNPDTRFGYAPLKFPRVFADEEREVFETGQSKVRREDFFERVQSLDALTSSLESAEPVFSRREFTEPGIGRRDDNLSAGTDQRGELPEATPGIAQAINQVRHQNHIKVSEVWPEFLRI